jgi:hypothetical protein
MEIPILAHEWYVPRKAIVMNRALLIAIGTMILSSAAAAQLPPRGYISLYADGDHAYSAYCPPPPGFPIAKVEMWMWCLPGENGLAGAEFAVGCPTNAMADRVLYNGHLSVLLGNPLEGISVRFDACQWDWCWVAHQSLYVNSLQQTYLEIVPHPGSGVFQFFSCAEGNPAEPCLKGTNLSLNATAVPCVPPETAIGAEGSTWGTMKSLFTE